MGTSGEPELSTIAGDLQADSHAIALGMVRHPHCRVVRAHDLNPAGAEIHADSAARYEFSVDWTFSNFLDFRVLSRNQSGAAQ
jgi:hypothetical protein